MLSINLPGDCAQLRLQLLVLLDVLAARHGHLHEDNLFPQLRVVVQEHVEPLQLLREPLDVVQSVDPDDHLLALVPLLEVFDAAPHLGLLESVAEFLRIDADNKLVRAD